MGVVVGVSAVKVTAVAVGTGGCGDGVAGTGRGDGVVGTSGGGVVGTAKGPHPERLNSMVRQATAVTFLTIDNLRADF
jgi:hypothetical protein